MYRGVTCMAETPCRCHSYERVTMKAIPAFNPWRAWGWGYTLRAHRRISRVIFMGSMWHVNLYNQIRLATNSLSLISMINGTHPQTLWLIPGAHQVGKGNELSFYLYGISEGVHRTGNAGLMICKELNNANCQIS